MGTRAQVVNHPGTCFSSSKSSAICGHSLPTCLSFPAQLGSTKPRLLYPKQKGARVLRTGKADIRAVTIQTMPHRKGKEGGQREWQAREIGTTGSEREIKERARQRRGHDNGGRESEGTTMEGGEKGKKERRERFLRGKWW